MYDAQTTKDRIKVLCKSKKINMEDMLISCDLGVNAIRQINDTKGMASFSLAKIADYLDCSVDYLLGRTDVPEINKPSEDVRIFKIAARDGEKEIELTAAQRAEIARIVENSKNDDNSGLF